ncbi:MAG: endolytic transglycosylase MltG [Armatimonadetes bacterium]|nr:endolytic transglycosylase MltG [Armatimonadota bacterium]
MARWYLIFVVALLAVTDLLLRVGAAPPTQRHDQVLITIPPAASREKVASILRGAELIRSRTVFLIITHVGYEGRPFVPGTYRMRMDMDLFRVINELVAGRVAELSVTIPEGFTVTQIAHRLKRKNVIADEELFLNLSERKSAEFGVESPTGSLEGYLFPDTYRFTLKMDPRLVIERMVGDLKRRAVQPNSSRLSDSGELHKILTVASLIEREAKTPEDRPLIASVIYNRLARNMRLQVDATVLYALKEHKSRVLYKDLDVSSAYNTYRHSGLPPGPIANPGLASIDAALHPASTDYLYYVAGSDGSHVFSRTFGEHISNRRKQSL